MIKILTLIALLSLSSGAVASEYDLWIGSYHFDKSYDYNAATVGIGATEGDMSYGVFINSYDNVAGYLTHTYGNQYGISIGMVYGYEPKVLPLVVPWVKIGDRVRLSSFNLQTITLSIVFR